MTWRLRLGYNNIVGLCVRAKACARKAKKIRYWNSSMQGLYYGIAAGIAALASALQIVVRKHKKISEKAQGITLKVFLYVFMAVFALRNLGGQVALTETFGLNVHSPFGADGQVKTFFSTIALWAVVPAFVLTATYPFFKDKIPSLTGLMKFMVTPLYLFGFVMIFLVPIGMIGADAFERVSFQGIMFAVEMGMGLALCAGVWTENYKTRLDFNAIGKCVLTALPMIVVCMPVYVPQVLLGGGPKTILLNDLNIEHRIILYGAFVVPAIIFAVLYRFDYNHRRFALLFMATAGMIGYSFRLDFEFLSDVTNWPLHLCNTAMFIVPLCLYFKLDKVFYFTLFINVLGAFFAMAMPNTSDGTTIFMVRSAEFWLNHHMAFFMPILLIALGMYERPKMRQFLYSLAGFGGYFLLVLILNAWFTNYGDVDFFFINSDFIAEKLGQWAEDLRDITATIHIGNISMVFYPLYQVLFFLVYVALSFAMWFLYEQGFQISDLYQEIFKRNKKIKADRLALEVKLAGRNITEPMNMETTNKLILKDFCKKYATSDVYAVKNANLEIEGGQIFGFLGPNGAGKSTIIKSIVGIQSITSGSISVCGYDVKTQSVGAKMQTGFVPDHYALYENLSGREYVNYIADLYGVSKEDRNARIEEYVTRFNLQAAFDNPIKTYSHGMKQKITIMSALVHSPKLWILDEPLTGLDPESIFQVKEAMKAHAAAGNIVFFSSHIIDVVERICDRIAIIKKGQILCTHTLKELEEKGIQLENYYMEKIGMNPEADKAKKEAEAAAEQTAQA